MLLDDKIVLLTGAGSGLGRSLAIELARKGAHLLLVGTQAAALQETAALLAPPASATLLAADVTNSVSIADLVDRVHGFGRLDLLINIADAPVGQPIAAEDGPACRRMIATNLLGPMELTLESLPLLHAAKPSRIVNIGTVLGDVALRHFSPHSATVQGLRGWSLALRRQLTPLGIHVTYASPGLLKTPAAEDVTALAPALQPPSHPTETVARVIVEGILRGAHEIYPSRRERLFGLLQRLMPHLVDRVLIGPTLKTICREAGELR
jgi:NAD(P)-dependent dehydrogenase (short-subunit alcohol dehydrogenase family)